MTSGASAMTIVVSCSVKNAWMQSFPKINPFFLLRDVYKGKIAAGTLRFLYSRYGKDAYTSVYGDNSSETTWPEMDGDTK